MRSRNGRIDIFNSIDIYYIYVYQHVLFSTANSPGCVVDSDSRDSNTSVMFAYVIDCFEKICGRDMVILPYSICEIFKLFCIYKMCFLMCFLNMCLYKY